MWPYTHDETNWLAVIAVLESTHPRHPNPPSIAELEFAARRYRSRVIADGLKSAFRGLGRIVRSALHRRAEPKAPPGTVVAD